MTDSARERAERLAWSASDIRSLLEENERLRRVVECARRLKEGEQIDAKMGYPLSGDSALASYLGTLDEALGDLDDRLEDNDAASERPDHD